MLGAANLEDDFEQTWSHPVSPVRQLHSWQGSAAPLAWG